MVYLIHNIQHMLTSVPQMIRHDMLMKAIRNVADIDVYSNSPQENKFKLPNKYNRDYYDDGHTNGYSSLEYFCFYKYSGCEYVEPTFNKIHWTVDAPPTIAYNRDNDRWADDDKSLFLVTLSISCSSDVTDTLISTGKKQVQFCTINAPGPDNAIWHAMNRSTNKLVRKAEYAKTNVYSESASVRAIVTGSSNVNYQVWVISRSIDAEIDWTPVN